MKPLPDPISKDLQGRVINFFPRKGYGFIESVDGEKCFVHYTDIKSRDYKTLNAGDEVIYDTVHGAKGLQASNVRVTRQSPSAPDSTPPTEDEPLKRKW